MQRFRINRKNEADVSCRFFAINRNRSCFIKLEIRSVERGICPIATSTLHNERTVPIMMAGCKAHARNGHISNSGLKSDVIIVLRDPDFL